MNWNAVNYETFYNCLSKLKGWDIWFNFQLNFEWNALLIHGIQSRRDELYKGRYPPTMLRAYDIPARPNNMNKKLWQTEYILSELPDISPYPYEAYTIKISLQNAFGFYIPNEIVEIIYYDFSSLQLVSELSSHYGATKRKICGECLLRFGHPQCHISSINHCSIFMKQCFLKQIAEIYVSHRRYIEDFVDDAAPLGNNRMNGFIPNFYRIYFSLMIERNIMVQNDERNIRSAFWIQTTSILSDKAFNFYYQFRNSVSHTHCSGKFNRVPYNRSDIVREIHNWFLYDRMSEDTLTDRLLSLPGNVEPESIMIMVKYWKCVFAKMKKVELMNSHEEYLSENPKSKFILYFPKNELNEEDIPIRELIDIRRHPYDTSRKIDNSVHELHRDLLVQNIDQKDSEINIAVTSVISLIGLLVNRGEVEVDIINDMRIAFADPQHTNVIDITISDDEDQDITYPHEVLSAHDTTDEDDDLIVGDSDNDNDVPKLEKEPNAPQRSVVYNLRSQDIVLPPPGQNSMIENGETIYYPPVKRLRRNDDNNNNQQ